MQLRAAPPLASRPLAHYQRTETLPFRASEKQTTTILFGTLTSRHEAMIQTVFQRTGYRCEPLPLPGNREFHTGKEYCNTGLCNPAYYTAGALVNYLRGLERQGMSRQEIIDNYVYFTASGCGPCRFGMYESEYGRALEHAGFAGFRVLTFQSNQGVYQKEKYGLEYTMDFGVAVFLAFHLGDVLYQLPYEIRPYEVNAGETDRVMAEVTREIADFFRTREYFDVLRDSPPAMSRWLARHNTWKRVIDNFGKFGSQCFGKDLRDLLTRCAARLNEIEVNLLRPKPRVKIVGEFYSMISEGECNFNMFRFLESEGAQVSVDPIASLVTYWLYQPRLDARRRKGLGVPHPDAPWWSVGKRLKNALASRKKDWLLGFSEFMWAWQYHRMADFLSMGQLPHLIPQETLGKLAMPYYHPLLRGGEGHLEVSKAIYYTEQQKTHMVLSLKPFGCMPSTQSDGVAAAVASHYPEMHFLSIETSGEGEINALSRVQMVLAEARRKARREHEKALADCGFSEEELRSYVASHRELRRPFTPLRERKGVAGVAAAFVRNVAEQMRKEGRTPGRRGAA